MDNETDERTHTPVQDEQPQTTSASAGCVRLEGERPAIRVGKA
jgi:hypothetical protein